MFLFTHFVKRFLVVLVHRKNMFSSERSDALVTGILERRTDAVKCSYLWEIGVNNVIHTNFP